MEYDAIWIGGGAAGRFGSSFMKALGGEPLVIDKDNHLGGKCCKNACVAEILFYDQASAIDQLRLLQGKMWVPKIDKRVSIREIAKVFRQGRESVYDFMYWQSKDQLDLNFILNKEAELIDKNTVEVDGEKYKTKNLVIGTGSRPHIPDVPGTDLRNVLTYQEIVDIDFEPEKVVVIGSTKHAAAYASFFNAFGCDTTLLGYDSRLFHFLDGEMKKYVIDMMKLRGIKLYERAFLEKIRGGPKVETVVAKVKGKRMEFDCDTVLLLTGVIPNSEIAKPLGVKIGGENEIAVDRRTRTSVPGVWAIGDVTGRPYEMWKARQSGMIAAKNIMGIDDKLPDYKIPHTKKGTIRYPDYMYTTYEVSWVGLTEEEARKKYKNVVIIKMPPDNPKGRNIPLPCAERTITYAHLYPELSGFHKAIIDGDSRKFLGFHHVGYGAKDAFQYLGHLLQKGLTVDEMAKFTELFLNPEHFIQLTRLRAGHKKLIDL